MNDGRATLHDIIAGALADALKPRYGGPQHNTSKGLPLTATAEEIRLHRARPLADAVLAVLPSVDRAAVLREGESALRQKAGQLSELAEETMRRDLEETAQIWHEAATALAQLAAEPPVETPPPDYTESVDYQVVGDWGVDGADSAAGARAAVAKWLRAYPKCGARAEQRIVREWEDGSEFYGPWTDLT